jgi:hypothetical protein
MISISVRGAYLRSLKLNTGLKVALVFKHAREAKGPTYSSISHKLHTGEKPTAIYGTAKCVFWNTEKG